MCDLYTNLETKKSSHKQICKLRQLLLLSYLKTPNFGLVNTDI